MSTTADEDPPTTPPQDGGDVPRAPDVPPFPIGGPSTTAWREEMLTRAQELAGLAAWIDVQDDRQEPAGALRTTIANQLETARYTAAGLDRRDGGRRIGPWPRLQAWLGGASFERTLGNLDAAEASLLRYAPAAFVLGSLPSISAHLNRFLPKDDPRRTAVEAIDTTAGLTEVGRHKVIAALHAANTQRRRNLIRVRNFRNLLACAFLTLSVMAVAVGALGVTYEDWLPLCFEPEGRVVCPLQDGPVPEDAGGRTAAIVADTTSRYDIVVIELLGVIAATLAAAVALRRLQGTTTPYGVPVVLALLKLPLGGLTAVLGILFLRGGFVPGLSALDSSGQILAYAIVFGYSQQVLTRLIDVQAHSLLSDVGGRGPAGDRPPAAA